jgi:sortase A
MLYQFLRTVANSVILGGLLLATFGFGGALGGAVDVLTAPPPRAVIPANLMPPVQKSGAKSLARPSIDDRPQDLAPAQESQPTLEANGFIPMLVPMPVTGEGPEALALQPSALQPTAPSEKPAPPAFPDRIVIPRIGLDAPIELSPQEWVQIDGRTYLQWDAPKKYAAGWQEGSAEPGQVGNFILTGHHNIYGKVFGRLHELEKGDVIAVYSGDHLFGYYVSQVFLLEERDVSMAQREENAMWIRPTADKRLTLVTCWPPDSNTHRLIVIAAPEK